MIVRLIALLFGCWHPARQRSWPTAGEQICLACGARRNYQLGRRPGPWRYDTPGRKGRCRT